MMPLHSCSWSPCTCSPLWVIVQNPPGKEYITVAKGAGSEARLPASKSWLCHH